MEIRSMTQLTAAQLTQAAQILTDSLPMGWATLNDAMAEVKERLIPENVLLAAIEEEQVLGWGGILPGYDGNVYELHPLAVSASCRMKGIGRSLMQALEAAARERGALTLWLGADDDQEIGETSLADADLFDNLPEKIRTFDAGTHQSAFYLKLGYQIIGVMPNASGRGRPDIYMAKAL